MRNRINWIDVTKGLAILLVLVGHTIQHNTLWKIIFSFHMPIFFIISGYLFKEERITKLALKNFQRMLIPYLGTSIIIVLTVAIAKLGFNHKFVYMPYSIRSTIYSAIYGCGVYPPNFFIKFDKIGAIWFLLCLFFSEFIFVIVLKLVKNLHILVQSAIFIFLSLLGYYIGQKIFLPWDIDISLICVLFLYSGYMFKKLNIINLKANFLVILLGFVLWAYSIYLGSMDMAARYYSNFLLCIISAIFGSYIIIKLCELISKSLLLDRFMSFYGRETLVILCFHLLEMNFFPWTTLQSLLNVSQSVLALVFMKFLFATAVVLLVKKIPVLNSIYYPMKPQRR